jgi:hypothetical protein
MSAPVIIEVTPRQSSLLPLPWDRHDEASRPLSPPMRTNRKVLAKEEEEGMVILRLKTATRRAVANAMERHLTEAGGLHDDNWFWIMAISDTLYFHPVAALTPEEAEYVRLFAFQRFGRETVIIRDGKQCPVSIEEVNTRAAMRAALMACLGEGFTAGAEEGEAAGAEAPSAKHQAPEKHQASNIPAEEEFADTVIFVGPNRDGEMRWWTDDSDKPENAVPAGPELTALARRILAFNRRFELPSPECDEVGRRIVELLAEIKL